MKIILLTVQEIMILEREPPSLSSSLPVGSIEICNRRFQLLAAIGIACQLLKDGPIVFGQNHISRTVQGRALLDRAEELG